MTLTLPSEYHKYKTLQRQGLKTKLIPNPKYNGITPKEAVKLLTKGGDVEKEEFMKEFKIMSSVRHPNLVFMFGCVLEPKLMMVLKNHLLTFFFFSNFFYCCWIGNGVLSSRSIV